MSIRLPSVLLASFVAVAACSSGHAQNAGPDSSRDFAVGAFSSIKVAGPYDVRVHVGGQAGVSAKGPRNILDNMVVEVDGNALSIHPKKGGMLNRVHWGKHKPIVIDVTAPNLDGAIVAGSGDIAVDRVSGAAFKGAIAGSGSLSMATVEVGKLKLEIAGSGDISAVGRAENAEYNIAGSGSIDGPKVATRNLQVSIAGSGDVAAHSSGVAKIKIMGSGDVTVTGGAKCTVSKMGSGNARCS